MFPPTLKPDIKTHPENAMSKAIIFDFPKCSLKNIADITDTIMGAVYKRIAATE